MRTLLLAVAMVILSVNTTLADSCERAKLSLFEAERGVVKAFELGAPEKLESAVNDLLFWDVYVQIECSGRHIQETPVEWMSHEIEAPLSPHKAGFLLWRKKLVFERTFDLDPAQLETE